MVDGGSIHVWNCAAHTWFLYKLSTNSYCMRPYIKMYMRIVHTQCSDSSTKHIGEAHTYRWSEIYVYRLGICFFFIFLLFFSSYISVSFFGLLFLVPRIRLYSFFSFRRSAPIYTHTRFTHTILPISSFAFSSASFFFSSTSLILIPVPKRSSIWFFLNLVAIESLRFFSHILLEIFSQCYFHPFLLVA